MNLAHASEKLRHGKYLLPSDVSNMSFQHSLVDASSYYICEMIFLEFEKQIQLLDVSGINTAFL